MTQKINSIHMDDESGNMVFSFRTASYNFEVDSGGNSFYSQRTQQDIDTLREIPVGIEVGRRMERLYNNTTGTQEHIEIRGFVPVLIALCDEKTKDAY